MGDKIFNNFDEIANDYRKIHNKNLGIIGGKSEAYAIAKVDEILQWEKETEKEVKFLDIGCGDGIVESILNVQRPNYSLFGVDISEESINLASVYKGTFWVYNGKNLPFDDNMFDVVFIANVLHHVEPDDRLGLLTEINRKLKEGGRIYLFEHNPWNPFTRYIVKTCPFDKGVKLLSSWRTQDLLSRSGFRVTSTRYITFFPKTINRTWIMNIEKHLHSVPLGGQYYIKAAKR